MKEEVKAPKPAEKAKPADKGKPAARPKLPPTKVKRGKMWDISGFEGETIEFQEKEVDMSTSFTITSCTDTTVIIHGKFNNASVTTCKNWAIIVENVIASVEIIKSNDVKLQVLHKCKQAIVDRSVKTGMKLLHNIFKQ